MPPTVKQGQVRTSRPRLENTIFASPMALPPRVRQSMTSCAAHQCRVAQQAELYAVATEDRMINPDLERIMAKRAGSTTIEVKGSHAIFMSQPEIVAKLIEQAAKDAK
jgi:hypothetical protein